MELNLSQIIDITQGAVRITQEPDGFHFYRFSVEQEELYRCRNAEFYMKSMATSGVQMRFLTNSQRLELYGTAFPGSIRKYFAFDIFVNSNMVGSINNCVDVDMSQNYAQMQLPLGDFSVIFDLGSGMKEVRIVFPWSVKAIVQKVVLDDGSVITSVKSKHTLLCYGDSITQGYDALCPSNKYVTKLAEFLDAEEINKAIGGEIFFPELAAIKEEIDPDYVLVAYGTNDWAKCDKEEFVSNCEAFYKNISTTYPSARILALTPIWRKEYQDITRCGEFSMVAETIQKAAGKYPNITIFDGYNFVPHDINFFGDLRLHPNDAGFLAYYNGLSGQI